MNPNLPKPMLDALARQTFPTDHPSADVLTAFAENALAGDEYRRTVDHLARCSDCREIVFLSVSVVDKPFQGEQHVAAAHGRRGKWMPRLVWVASIAAVVLVLGSAMTLWRSKSAPSGVQMASKAVSVPAAQRTEQAQPTQPAVAPQTTTEIAVVRPIEKPQAKAARAKPVSPNGAETIGMGSSAGIVGGAVPAPSKAAPALTTMVAKTKPATTNAEPGAITIGNAAAAAPAPHVNSFDATEGGPLGAAPGSAGAVLLNPQMARSLRVAHPQWRITAEGHLEHLTAEGWTRVLAEHTANFRVVSVVGNHVWVGGSAGALLHSRDEGQSWQEVTLNTSNGRETATIVSIQFDDSQRGTVTTDNGTRCTTTDGGGSWNCSAAQE